MPTDVCGQSRVNRSVALPYQKKLVHQKTSSPIFCYLESCVSRWNYIFSNVTTLTAESLEWNMLVDLGHDDDDDGWRKLKKQNRGFHKTAELIARWRRWVMSKGAHSLFYFRAQHSTSWHFFCAVCGLFTIWNENLFRESIEKFKIAWNSEISNRKFSRPSVRISCAHVLEISTKEHSKVESRLLRFLFFLQLSIVESQFIALTSQASIARPREFDFHFFPLVPHFMLCNMLMLTAHSIKAKVKWHNRESERWC